MTTPASPTTALPRPAASLPAAALAAALALLLAACDGRVGQSGPAVSAAPDRPAPAATDPSPAAAPAPSLDDGASGPVMAPTAPVIGGGCQTDADCVPMSPCGLQAGGACVARGMAPQVAAECARPAPPTHRCVCAAGRCDSRPIGAP